MPRTVDTTTDTWLAKCKDSVETEKEDENLGRIAAQISQMPEPKVDPQSIPPEPAYQFPEIRLGAPAATTGCPLPASFKVSGNSPLTIDPKCRVIDCRLPFCGRDVILVHGLRTGPLVDFFREDPRGLTTWPANPSEFLIGGYWFEGAKTYWANYVVNKLGAEYANVAPGQRMPRVLFIAYPVTQRLKVGSNAMLHQIADAMRSGTNVYTLVRNNGVLELQPLTTTNDPLRGVGFCTLKCVIVSHSTGGPLTNVAMAEGSQMSPATAIQRSIKAHVAIEPAFSGSNHANLALVAAVAIAANPVGCLGSNSNSHLLRNRRRRFKHVSGGHITLSDNHNRSNAFCNDNALAKHYEPIAYSDTDRCHRSSNFVLGPHVG